jgi:hypothetical protein
LAGLSLKSDLERGYSKTFAIEVKFANDKPWIAVWIAVRWQCTLRDDGKPILTKQYNKANMEAYASADTPGCRISPAGS